MESINNMCHKIDDKLPKALPTCKFSAGAIAIGAGIGAVCTRTLEGAQTGALAVSGLLAGTSLIRACAYTGEMSKKTLALITLVGATVLYRESLGSVVQTAAKSALDRLEPLNQTLFEDPIVNTSNNTHPEQPKYFFVDSPIESETNNINGLDQVKSEHISSTKTTSPLVTDFKFSVWASETKLSEGKEFSEWKLKYQSIVQNCSSPSKNHIERLQCYDEGLTKEPTRGWIKGCIITIENSETPYRVEKEHLDSAKKACSGEDTNGWGWCMTKQVSNFYV